MSGIDKFKDKMYELKESSFEDWFDNENCNHSQEDLISRFWYDYDESDFDREMDDKIQEQEPQDIEAFKASYLESELKEKARGYYDERYENFINELDDHFDFVDESHVKIYRSIVILASQFSIFLEGLKENKFLEKHKGIGVCWAFNKAKADAHNAGHTSSKEKTMSLMLIAVAPIETINERSTFLLNMDSSCGEDEAEIRIANEQFIHLIAIENEYTKETIELDLVVHSGGF